MAILFQDPGTRLAYRNRVRSVDLVRFQVKIKETELLISAERWLEREAVRSVLQARQELEDHIITDPLFLHTLAPRQAGEGAAPLVQEMARAGQLAGVGPMAAVAGAIAERVGHDLLPLSEEVIVENGGDLFLKIKKERSVAIVCESSAFQEGIEFMVEPRQTPLGICTSSGTLGHSLSLGRADAVTVLAQSAALADAMATAVGNRIQEVEDIDAGIAFCRRQKEIMGVVIVVGEHLGVWGDIHLLG